MTLKELEIGKSAVIETVGGSGELRQHFLDMGMIPGAEVTVVKLAPMGDPMELQVHGYELTLRLAEADQIEIAPISKRTREHKGLDRVTDAEHPGLGEDGKYHQDIFHLPWREIRTAARRHCSISSPARISMWEISPELP
jgi:ferrous iron transport protein B